MKKLLLYLCLIVLIVLGVVAYNYNQHVTLPNVASTPAPWQPTHLRIPRMGIDTNVISVGTTPSGQMDAPVSKAINSPYWTSVFWYGPGAAPGQAGNAVIAGHVDRVGGDPAVFWSLDTLKVGDPIFVTTGHKDTLKFVVERVVHYPADASSDDVLNAVFGSTTEHHLNLITCSGVWTGQGYDQRLVVFTTQVS